MMIVRKKIPLGVVDFHWSGWCHHCCGGCLLYCEIKEKGEVGRTTSKPQTQKCLVKVQFLLPPVGKSPISWINPKFGHSRFFVHAHCKCRLG